MGVLWHFVFLGFMELRIFHTFNISEEEDCLELSVRIQKKSVVTGPTVLGWWGQGEGWQKLSGEYNLYPRIPVIENAKDEINFLFMAK